MGKSRVKGIVVEIGGDTIGLNKALDGTNKKINTTQSNLKDVERLLKLDPTNTKLLEQKQRLLGEAIAETEEKLQTLNKAHADNAAAVQNYDDWKQVYDPIKAEIDETREKLKKLNKQQAEMETAGDVNTEGYQKLKESVDETSKHLKELKDKAEEVTDSFGRPISQEQFDALQREIAETELDLKSLRESAEKNLGNLCDAVDPVKKKFRELGDTAESVKTKADGIADKFKPVTAAVAGLATAAVATVPATEELREDLSKLDANAKENAVSVEAARKAWKEFAIQSGETDSAVEAVSNLLQANFTESNLQKAVEGLAGAAQRFPDTLKVESLADSLQETLASGEATGQFSELLSRLSMDVEAFSGSLAACTTEAEKQDLVLKTLADAGLNESYEAWKQNNEAMLANKDANLELELSMAELAKMVMPVVTDVTSAIAQFIDRFANLPGPVQTSIAVVLGLVAAIAPLASAVSHTSALIETLSKMNLPGFSSTVGSVIGFISDKSNAIVSWMTGTAFPAVKTGLAVTANFISTQAGNIVHWITGTALPAVKTGFSVAMTFVKTQIYNVFTWITGTALPALQTGFTTVMNFIAANPIVLLIGAIVALVALIATKGDEIQGVLQKVDDFLQGIFVKDWTEVFGLVLGDILNAFFANLKNIWDAIKQIFSGVIDFIQGVFTGDWERAWHGVVDIFGGLFKGLETIAKAPINAIIELLNGAISGFNILINGANKLPGVNISTIGKIPYLANGGEVLRGSAIVGEAGPELLTVLGDRTIVQPLSGNSVSHSTHLGAVYINVYGSPGQDVHELAEIVMEEMQHAYGREEAALA